MIPYCRMSRISATRDGKRRDKQSNLFGHIAQPEATIPPFASGTHNGGRKRTKKMNEKTKNNRYRTFGRMVAKGSDKQPSLYAIHCGRLTAAEICRLLARRGLDDVASITAAGRPLDGLRMIWSCYALAAENGFSTPYPDNIAIAARASIDKLEGAKAILNSVNRKIAAAMRTAEVVFRANNPEPNESEYPNGGIAAAREAWEIRLAKARADAETAEMREAFNVANEEYNAAKLAYANDCKAFDAAYLEAIDKRRAGLSPLKQCGAEDSNN